MRRLLLDAFGTQHYGGRQAGSLPRVVVMSTDHEAATKAVEFDPFSDVFFDDPYPTYKRLRDEAPVYYNEAYGFWALSRHEDVVGAHRDWQSFTSTHGVDLVGMKSGPP